MDSIIEQTQPVKEQKTPSAVAANPAPIGKDQLRQANRILMRYKAGKANLERRIIQDQQWWRMRHWDLIHTGNPYDIKPTTAWLFNTIINKHADMMEAYPMPNILPREEGDKIEAQSLSAIVPVVMEQNQFDQTYSDAGWQKLIEGTGVYSPVWNRNKLNGLGDIEIRNISVLNLFWEPGISDIQQSRHLFHVELVDRKVLEDLYPKIKNQSLTGNQISVAQYVYDDAVDITDKALVIDWYYHKWVGGKKLLHYCKYVNDTVLYASENDMERPKAPMVDPSTGQALVDPDTGTVLTQETGLSIAETGWYDHGEYPFVFDRLFPTEGSPCGFGYVDVCKSSQEQIDLLNQAIVKNAVMASTPRAIIRGDGAINEEEFADWTRPLVHTNGNLGEDSFRWMDVPNLSSVYVTFLNNKIQEMRETSGNTETAAGSTTSGVTAAAAIAALQEASGKTSRDSTKSAYRAYAKLVTQVIELIRQFYDLPRRFRITGKAGEEQFISYSNAGLLPQSQGMAFGVDMGYRLPVFDIEVSAEAMNTYSRISQNEMALQLYQMGVFHPQMTDQALMLLDTMDFPRKEGIMQRIAQNGTLYQQLQLYQELALTLAQQYDPATYQQLVTGIGQQSGALQAAVSASKTGNSKKASGNTQGESRITEKAREQSSAASLPD